MINIADLTLQRGTKILFEHATAIIYAKQKIGLVGINGCGKSSLFALLLKQLEPDGGEVYLQHNLKTTHLSQETPNSILPAIEYVIQGDKELIALLTKINKAESNQDGILLAELHSKLSAIDGYAAKARAGKLLNGLGFLPDEHEKIVNEFSGGWRMRLNLAQTLMSRSDIMLLDEPTNHLDLDAIIWLENWLKNYSGILFLISHDREFLDNVVTRILHIENLKLNSYTGNYSDFERERAQNLAQQQAQYEKQQDFIERNMRFVNRFRYKATKARQAQSRLKALEKLELIAAVQNKSQFSFEFRTTKKITEPLIKLEQINLGYSNNIVLQNINKIIYPDARIGLLGPNGAGKSTLIKCFAGLLQPHAGDINTNNAIKIGYFAQHQIEQLNLNQSPVWHLQQIDNKSSEQELRKFIGSFNFSGDMALLPITNFSGGEKARLVLALIVWQAPNLLLLDEPTNHLDLEMREALNLALQNYDGAMVLVSHDRHLLRTTTDELWLVYDHKVTDFDGDLEDYKNWVLENKQNVIYKKSFAKSPEKNVIQDETKTKKILQNKLKKIEAKLDLLHDEKVQVEAKLANDDLYQENNKKLLAELLLCNQSIQEQIKNLESEWEDISNSF